MKNGASNPVWSPDGKSILFSSNYTLAEISIDSTLNPAKSVPAWPTEKAGFINNDYLKQNNVKADPNGSLEEIRAYLALNEKIKSQGHHQTSISTRVRHFQ